MFEFSFFLFAKKKRGLLERGWRGLASSLSAQRGPWNDPDHETRWMVHRSESDSWTRVLRKPNTRFDPHENCARGPSNAPASSSSSSATVALPLAAAFLRGDMEAEEDEESEAHGGGGEEESKSGAMRARLVRAGRASEAAALEVSRTHVVLAGKAWALEQLLEMRLVRHVARKCALELELVGGRTRLIVLDTERDARVLYRTLLSLRPPKLHPHHFSTVLRRRHPPSASSRMNFGRPTEKWLAGNLSNFDYLMQLNKIAGRSYNTLSYYPIMPWVLADWTSSTLNLDDPKVFFWICFF